MRQAFCESAMSQGANKEPGGLQGAKRASNDPGNQQGTREAVMSQRASNESDTL